MAPRTGRPRLSQSERKRHRLTVHLTDNEWRKLVGLADERNANIGAMASELVVEGLKRRRT